MVLRDNFWKQFAEGFWAETAERLLIAAEEGVNAAHIVVVLIGLAIRRE